MAVAAGGGGFRGGGVAAAPAAAASGLAPLPAPAPADGVVAGGDHRRRSATSAAAAAIAIITRGGGFWPGVAIGAGIGSSYGYYDSNPYYYDDPGYYDEGVVAAQPAPAGDDSVAYCMQRYKSYDPASGTYLGYDGQRHPCPERNSAIAVSSKGGAFSVRRPFRLRSYERSATATPPSVNASAASSRRPSGSCSIAAAASTPMTGTSKVPIEAVAAGSRSSAANQHT